MKMDNEKYIRSLVGHIPMHRPVAVLVIYKDNKVLLQKDQIMVCGLCMGEEWN